MGTELKTGELGRHAAGWCRWIALFTVWQMLTSGALCVLAMMPLTVSVNETWEFVDGDGVVHMGNVSGGPGAELATARERVNSQEPAPPEGKRELKWIHRTWALRFPVWDPATAVTTARPAVGVSQSQAAIPRLPRGLNDVKPYLDAAAQSHSVDPALIYSVAAAESAFNTEAVSHKGALGLMQIMPGTAARYGVTGYSLDTGRHNVLEPKVNAQVGSRYLADLLRMFGGDASLAVAAYNAGEGAVSKYGNRIPPYPETQKYVERVMGYYRSFNKP